MGIRKTSGNDAKCNYFPAHCSENFLGHVRFPFELSDESFEERTCCFGFFFLRKIAWTPLSFKQLELDGLNLVSARSLGSHTPLINLKKQCFIAVWKLSDKAFLVIDLLRFESKKEKEQRPVG